MKKSQEWRKNEEPGERRTLEIQCRDQERKEEEASRALKARTPKAFEISLGSRRNVSRPRRDTERNVKETKNEDQPDSFSSIFYPARRNLTEVEKYYCWKDE